jgi:hypothetical protein
MDKYNKLHQPADLSTTQSYWVHGPHVVVVVVVPLEEATQLYLPSPTEAVVPPARCTTTITGHVHMHQC